MSFQSALNALSKYCFEKSAVDRKKTISCALKNIFLTQFPLSRLIPFINHWFLRNNEKFASAHALSHLRFPPVQFSIMKIQISHSGLKLQLKAKSLSSLKCSLHAKFWIYLVWNWFSVHNPAIHSGWNFSRLTALIDKVGYELLFGTIKLVWLIWTRWSYILKVSCFLRLWNDL